MTTQEKAKQFLEFNEQGDPRCFMTMMMLSQMFNLTPEVVLDKIKELADATIH